jgi:hypothetical protein
MSHERLGVGGRKLRLSVVIISHGQGVSFRPLWRCFAQQYLEPTSSPGRPIAEFSLLGSVLAASSVKFGLEMSADDLLLFSRAD